MNYKNLDELPIYNYNKILETQDFKKYGVDTKDWEKIEKEFFVRIGYGEKFFEILRIKTSIVLNKANYYKTNNNALKTLIEIEKAKLKQLTAEQTGGDFSSMVAQVSKFMGFRIDVKEVSVIEFYSFLKVAQNG